MSASALQPAMGPTSRWWPAHLDPRQMAYLNSTAQFNWVAAGRRSFKTEGAKRRTIRAALAEQRWPDARYFGTGPTQQQAKDIFWNDFKAMIPAWAIKGRPSESELKIRLRNGALVQVAGLDKPSRIEGGDGGFWDGGVVDESADTKPDVVSAHILPMLARGGWVDVIGVPEGRNHFFHECMNAKTLARAGNKSYAYHHWTSAEVMHLYLGRKGAEDYLALMKAQMDPRTYAQEFDASFSLAQGRAYYCFDADAHASRELEWDKRAPLIVCLDFNVSPGTAVLCQERSGLIRQLRVGEQPLNLQHQRTDVIGEVYIETSSNTPMVCRKIIQDWGAHRGPVKVYGDPSGGADRTSGVEGSDWELVERYLGAHFGAQLDMRHTDCRSGEKRRVNALNTRMATADGRVHMQVDPINAPMTVRDFEGVQVVKGSDGEIAKKGADNEMLTHLTDGLGYYIDAVYPIDGALTLVEDF